MKHWMLAAALICFGSAARANSPYAGKLDLKDPNFDAVVIRELNDGMWLMGAQRQVFHIERVADGAEILHVSVFWASRPEGTDVAYGPSLGLNLKPAVQAALAKLGLVPEAIGLAAPPFVSKLADVLSIEAFGGYRPNISADSHHFIYGVGAKVTIPVDQLAGFIMKSAGGGL